MAQEDGIEPPSATQSQLPDNHSTTHGNSQTAWALNQAAATTIPLSQIPTNTNTITPGSSPPSKSVDHMQLDGTTIENLELLVNQSDRTTQNSLWSKLNQTKSPHGSRLLRAWLLRPLFRKTDINRRVDAVEELAHGSAALAMSEARPILSKVGDLERLLSRIHSMGLSTSGNEDTEQPNDRAILYEGGKYTKRKVEDFRKLLLGLRYVIRAIDAFAECGTNLRSGLLKKLVLRQSQGGCFPDMEEDLEWFHSNFDCEKAKNGLYEPSRGMDEEYDEACDTVERILGELDDYKREMCGLLGRDAAGKWKYINTKPESRDKYLIELPVGVNVPSDFYVKGKRGSGAKQVNKYRTATVENLINNLDNALEAKNAGKARGMQIVFAKFDTLRPLWAAAAQATAMLDALGALALVSGLPDFSRPTILDCNDGASPVIRVEQGRHPCVDVTHRGGDFIPNDLTLGGGEDDNGDGRLSSRVLLLSGPNMGGKSTLLRQTCLIAILAQIGCFVPATQCALTPLDRIFTRLGASDRILSGQSTFFVELAETAAALRGASSRSLVIMDELGRGTSTFDGTAIASATVKHLVEKSGCLALFATHYHSLLEDWKEERSVRLGHMECLVEAGVDRDASGGVDHNITFLYTLGEGACPRSFGINVARLAGLPEKVLLIAKRKSAAFERELNGDSGMEVDTNNDDHEESVTVLERMKAAVKRGDLDEAESLWDSLMRVGL
eukprot:CAMPEP_0195526514 /NCGR_PEP_ID=MMETSP0794_2-20130614/27623_1 /TAXON_ID=515487 /ORGANISM="Stephanopyxis turris, Strain CCMP 815" /LENGTH=725 /DNA_ID=CAMNT_0040657219 /DNA_START=35 /DNA_END=2212 /DNA_ORIENTATION=+